MTMGMMHSKREMLLKICEAPGATFEDASTNDRWLNELFCDDWIQKRGDGWEATAQALDEFPSFINDDELRDPMLEGHKALTEQIPPLDPEWIYERTLPLMRLHGHQKVEGTVPDLEMGLQGVVVFGMIGEFLPPGYREIEIRIRIR